MLLTVRAVPRDESDQLVEGPNDAVLELTDEFIARLRHAHRTWEAYASAYRAPGTDSLKVALLSALHRGVAALEAACERVETGSHE